MFSLDEVIPGLYVGDALAACSLTTLKHFKITHVLVAGEELTQNFPDQFVYKQLPVADTLTFDISQYFQESNDFIENSLRHNGRVLIHCKMGISRSTTLAIAYVMAISRMPYEKANRLVKKKHKGARPNSGFITQLQAYEKDLQEPAGICCYLM
mmetsp:Transcript_24016/g.42633  ORF Transcript_24016/g.42633 Transcript_24016/m.42633 type:complete len:154 (-) Transcript_24016:23-484(-)